MRKAVSLAPVFIGICGRARHGKDLFAHTITKQFSSLGLRCFHSSFSNMVLEEAYETGIISHNDRSRCTSAEINLLVQLGHQGRRRNIDHWLEKMSEKIIAEQPDVVIVPGVRFPNEIEWVRMSGGVIVRVTRLNQDGSTFISLDRDPNDPMETILNRVVADFEIIAMTGQNNWLKAQAHSFYRFMLEQQADKLPIKDVK